MKSVISDNKIIPFLPCYKRTSQLHETKVSDLKTVYGCNGYAVYDYIENEIFRTGNHSLYWCKNMLCRVADYWALSPEEVVKKTGKRFYRGSQRGEPACKYHNGQVLYRLRRFQTSWYYS